MSLGTRLIRLLYTLPRAHLTINPLPDWSGDVWKLGPKCKAKNRVFDQSPWYGSEAGKRRFPPPILNT